jgi:hypothetical protein
MVNKLKDEHENFFDLYMYKFIDSHIHIYKNLRLTPNMITTLSLISGISSAYMIFKKQYKFAGILFLIQYYFDCTDGKVARKYNMTSKFGDYYDHISDTIKYLLLIYVLYKDNFNKLKKVIIVIILLLLMCFMHIGCQNIIYTNNKNEESPSLNYLKGNREACLKHINKLKYFAPGTITLVLSIIIFFWDKID